MQSRKWYYFFFVNSGDESSNAIQQLELISRFGFQSWPWERLEKVAQLKRGSCFGEGPSPVPQSVTSSHLGNRSSPFKAFKSKILVLLNAKHAERALSGYARRAVWACCHTASPQTPMKPLGGWWQGPSGRSEQLVRPAAISWHHQEGSKEPGGRWGWSPPAQPAKDSRARITSHSPPAPGSWQGLRAPLGDLEEAWGKKWLWSKAQVGLLIMSDCFQRSVLFGRCTQA